MKKISSLTGEYSGTPFAIDVKGGENVERARIFPSMTKGEIVNLGFH